MNNWLKVIVGISAILIAGCAAFFSVTGLGVLFSGASVAVMIMAGSLEFAKLGTATYLKQSWDKVHGFNKWYLTGAVAILMVITSAGIFGYLSNAFQQQNIKLDQVQREISVWNNKISSNETQVKMLTDQLKNLESNQGKILDNGKVNRSLLKSVDNRDKEASKIRNKISALQDSSVVYNSKINDIKNNNIGLEREVGGFRFVAEAFGVELKNVVKFFIILIVIVFDPLAIALVIAFNQLVINGFNPKDDDKPKEDEVNIDPEEIKNIISESDRIKPTENDLKKIENILNKKQYVNKEDIIKYHEDDSLTVSGEIIPDGEHILIKTPIKKTYKRGEVESILKPKIKEKMEKEVYPALSDEETYTMNMDEWERNLDMEEELYEPTHEEEQKNFSNITPIEHTEDKIFSTNEPKIENNFQQEDGWTEEMEERYWKEQVPEPFATPEEVEELGIDKPIEETPKVETIEEPTQEIPEEKKK